SYSLLLSNSSLEESICSLADFSSSFDASCSSITHYRYSRLDVSSWQSAYQRCAQGDVRGSAAAFPADERPHQRAVRAVRESPCSGREVADLAPEGSSNRTRKQRLPSSGAFTGTTRKSILRVPESARTGRSLRHTSS